MALILLQHDGPVLHLRLNRPDVRNALNGEMIQELESALEKAQADSGTRVVVLAGEGSSFCAGADLSWFQSSSVEEEGRRFARLLALLDNLPKPTIAKVHGAAIGGGIGLLSACDIAVAAEETVFAFGEVKLGLIPAVISPYVIQKIGPSAAHRYFLTGERFDAATALRMGLIHESVPAAGLEAKVQAIVQELLSSGPTAIASCKELIREVSRRGEVTSPLQEYTVRQLCEIQSSPEARRRIQSFLEKKDKKRPSS